MVTTRIGPATGSPDASSRTVMLKKIPTYPILFVAMLIIAIPVIADKNTSAHTNTNTHQFYHHNVLGSSLEMRISSPQNQAGQAQQSVLAEIIRLEKIFSSYDRDSELNRLNRGSLQQQPSAELVEMVRLCEQWRQKLPKAFSCRMGDVIEAWQDAFQRQARPNRKQIRTIARRAVESRFTLADLESGNSTEDFSWNFGAIAKGYILDRALQVARQSAPGATAIGIDIGGDAAYWQAEVVGQPWKISIADPNNIDDSKQQHLGKLHLHNGAIAYSGHNSRALKIGRRSYSHILVPRDGWPKQYASTAIVTAPTATEADALATALATMEIPAALDWLEQQGSSSVAAMLVGSDGRSHSTPNWHHRFHPPGQVAPSQLQATIRFALPKPRGGVYRRPYVALWLENSRRKVVKNLLLLGDSERWMSENSYWWRKQGRTGEDLLQGLARPTRRAGEYRLSWHGRDDFGRVLGSRQLHAAYRSCQRAR